MTEPVRRRNTPVDDAEVIRAVYRCTPAGTTEVADRLGVSRQAAAYQLKNLEEAEYIWSKKVGPTRVWLHPLVLDRR